MRPTWLRRRGRVVAAAAVLAAVLTACGGSAQNDSAASRPHSPATLGGVVMSDPVPASIARLPLTTAAGQRTTLAAYRGKIVVIADSLTLCQDMCPMISANVAAMARQVQAAGLAGQIALLEITVDPQRDTRPGWPPTRKCSAVRSLPGPWRPPPPPLPPPRCGSSSTSTTSASRQTTRMPRTGSPARS